MAEHIVSAFEQELVALGEKIFLMGGLTEKILSDSIDALWRKDSAYAQRIIASDKEIDALEYSIEEQSVQMIALRQPMALDLREIMAAIRISSDLERVGDLAKNIAKRALAIGGEGMPKRLSRGVEHMSQLALGQLKDVLDAYSRRDAQAATDVWRRDEAIDAFYTSLFRELLTYMMEDPRNITMCTHLLFAAKNIERIGDHTTNIAETVHYLATGNPIADERPKGDQTSYTPVSTETGEK